MMEPLYIVSRLDVERPGEPRALPKGVGRQHVIPRGIHRDLVAVLEFDVESASLLPGLDGTGAVLQVFHVGFRRVLANQFAALRTRAEAQRPECAAEVVPAQKPHLGVEVVADREVLEAGAVAVGPVVEAALG